MSKEQNQSGENQWVYMFFILGQSILYGIGNPVTKIAYDSLTVFWCLTFRFTLAALLFLLFFGRKILSQLRGVSVMTYLPTSLCMAVAYISVNMALKYSPATIVGFIMSLPVVLTPVLRSLLLKKPYPWKKIPLQMIIVMGLYLLCCGQEGLQFGVGEVCAMVTAVALAAGMVLGEKSLYILDSTTISCTQAGATALISVLCACNLDGLPVWSNGTSVANLKTGVVISQVQPAAWLVVGYLAVGCTCLAYFLQNAAIARLSSQTVALLQTSQPILTAACSFLILGETLTWSGYLGAGLIFVCLIYESMGGRKEKIIFLS